MPAEYQAQLEELASHGYVVAGIEHAPDALKSFEERAVLWAKDLISVKQMILRSRLRGQIDVNRIGAFGHSHRGRSAAAACLLDRAFRACLNQDGIMDDVKLRRPYWPIAGRRFSGAFALMDWFDPGFDSADFESMNTTREQYASTRLTPTAPALQAFRAAERGAYRIVLLSPGMQHTAFSDSPLLQASSESERNRYAAYLSRIRAATVGFFNHVFKSSDHKLKCGIDDEVLIQCFQQHTQ